MIDHLHIAILEYDLVWLDKDSNYQTVIELMDLVPEQTHLVLLPEMFNTGFVTEADAISAHKEKMNGKSVQLLKSIASKRNCWLMGTLLIEENKQIYNRLVVVGPKGERYYYNKRHLFSYGGEQRHIAKGNQRVIVEIEGWRILLGICYDLRFPVFSRNKNDYDALVYLSNWPNARRKAWNTLLPARAIENQAYAVGVNIKGKQANKILYTGDSAIYDPEGKTISQLKNSIICGTFSKENLLNNRLKYPFLQDADAFKLL